MSYLEHYTKYHPIRQQTERSYFFNKNIVIQTKIIYNKKDRIKRRTNAEYGK